MRHRPEKTGVLVVDDEPLVRTMVQWGLESSGLDVWVAASGRQAVELYRKHRDRIAVVLLEVALPDLDGPTTLAQLRTLDPNVLACFLCGDPGDYSPEDLSRCGPLRVIAKPFRLLELAQFLRSVVYGTPAELVPPSEVGCP